MWSRKSLRFRSESSIYFINLQVFHSCTAIVFKITGPVYGKLSVPLLLYLHVQFFNLFITSGGVFCSDSRSFSHHHSSLFMAPDDWQTKMVLYPTAILRISDLHSIQFIFLHQDNFWSYRVESHSQTDWYLGCMKGSYRIMWFDKSECFVHAHISILVHTQTLSMKAANSLIDEDMEVSIIESS